MLDHVPPPRHPERPERLQAILRHLDRTGLGADLPGGHGPRGDARGAAPGPLARATSTRSRAFELKGGGPIEADTWVSPGSNQAARLAAGAAVEAVDARRSAGPTDGPSAWSGRPATTPGPTTPMGFCLYDNVAVAAADAVERLGLDRVLIVDFDVHHGNGTQEIFYDDPRVAFLSIHRYPFYPGTGAADETGTGRGLGFTQNVPIRYGTSRADYHAAFRAGLDDAGRQGPPRARPRSARGSTPTPRTRSATSASRSRTSRR